ncbi:hypothetical protein BGZ63DRAFT_399185 [Mariannaea sp. PMI_226]|nr:hypothetical protein BGZ63DRAFT_399185 [Mariannaea sp. PMI_226]
MQSTAVDAANTVQPAFPFMVSPVCHEDVPALVDIYLAAFRDDFNATTVSERSRQRWARDLLAYISDPSVHLLKCMKRTGDSESIVGWAQWTPSAESASDTESCDSTSDDSDADETWDWGSDEDHSDAADKDDFRIFTKLKASRSKSIGEESWLRHNPPNLKRILWHLDVIAVSPRYQKLGVECQLLENILIMADETGSELCTEVNPKTAPMYRGFGFEDKGLISFANRAASDDCLIMVRKPDMHQRLKVGVGQSYY